MPRWTTWQWCWLSCKGCLWSMHSRNLCCEKHYSSSSDLLCCLCEQSEDTDSVQKEAVRKTATFKDQAYLLQEHAASSYKEYAEPWHDLHGLQPKSKVRQAGFNYIQSKSFNFSMLSSMKGSMFMTWLCYVFLQHTHRVLHRLEIAYKLNFKYCVFWIWVKINEQ
jgi:hypothetical protein